MKKNNIFLIALLLFASNASHAQSYEKISGNDKGGLYIEKGSIDKSGDKNIPSVRVLMDMKDGIYTPNGFSYSQTIHTFFDCKAERQITTTAIYHEKGMGKGRTLGIITDVSNDPIYMQKVFKRLCG